MKWRAVLVMCLILLAGEPAFPQAFDEILAVLHLVEDQFGMFRDQIPAAVVKLFGLERASIEASDIVRAVVDSLVEANQLHSSGFRVHLP